MATSKPHLYLVLEDWENGYTIRKIDVESFDAAGDGGVNSKEPEPLPDPPLLRVEAEHGQAAFFTAVGTRILAMHRSAGAGIPVLDTATLGLVVAPRPPGDALAQCPTLVAVGGDRIYGLECGRASDREPRHFEVLHAPAPPRRKQWSWSTVPATPPFNPLFVASYAVHPDGRTVFFSVECFGSKKKNSGTFSFDTKLIEWSYRGDWLLPFRGQAHYDGELNAWVGLGGGHSDDADTRRHVCSCDVVEPGGAVTPPPAWKVGAELLFCEDKKRHAGAALVYMGDSRFCLLECVKPKAGKKKKNKEAGSHGPANPPRHLLNVTAFGLKYGKQGELMTAMRRRGRCYVVPEEAANFLGNPVAFWM